VRVSLSVKFSSHFLNWHDIGVSHIGLCWSSIFSLPLDDCSLIYPLVCIVSTFIHEICLFSFELLALHLVPTFL